MHEGAALVGGKLGPLPGSQTQHVLQEIAVPAGVVFFELTGRDAEPPAQQRFQRLEVADLTGAAARHPAQEGKALGFRPAGGMKGLGEAGALDLRQGPAAAQHVEAVGGSGGKVGQIQLRRTRSQHVHDGFEGGAEGLALPLRPAEPEAPGRGGEGLIKADLFPHHPVLEAVRKLDLLRHQGVAVGVGQQARLAGRGGEFALGEAQHKDIVRCVKAHLACAGQHHGVQRLGDVAEVGRAQQQPEQLFVLGDGDALAAQQARHLIQQAHDHVPLPGGFLGGGDAPLGPDGLHLRGLSVLRAQLLQAEVEGTAHLLGVGRAELRAQAVGGGDEKGAGLFGPGKIFFVLVGGLHIAEAPGVLLEGRAPRRRVGRPGVGVVLKGADLFLGEGAEAGLGQGGELFRQLCTPGESQQTPHRRGRGAELGSRRLIAIEGDVRHPELVLDGGAVFRDVAADHRHLPAADALPHEAADGGSGGAGFFLPAGSGEKLYLRAGRGRVTPARGQQLGRSGEAGGVGMAHIPAQQFRHGHRSAVPAGQLAQLGRHLLRAGEKAHIPRHERGAVVAEGHRHGGQRGQQGAHQPLFRGVEGVELVDKDGPVPQELRQFAPGQCGLEAGCGQLQPVGGVHACPGQQGLVALKDEGQFAELGAVGAAVLRQLIELLTREARALELVDGLGGHLAEGGRAAVAVIVMDIVLQFLEGAAHQHGTARVAEGLDGRASLRRQDMLGEAGEGKALHQSAQRVAQLPVDAALGGRGELLRHQQDALLPRLGPRPDALVQQGGLSAAGTA